MTRTLDPAHVGAGLAAFGDTSRLADLAALADRHPGTRLHAQLGVIGTTDLATVEARWREVPPTVKAELLSEQRDRPPFGRRLLVPASRVTLVVESSGSSGGEKEVHCLSREDDDRAITMIAAHLRGIGFSASDLVALTLPLGTAGGGWKLYAALREIGALVLRIGSLSTEEKVEHLMRFGATAIVGTPSYVDRLAAVVRARGVDPARLSVRRIAVATQAMSGAWVSRTEACWGARVYEWYGVAAGFFAMTCREGVIGPSGQRGTLHWDPSYQLLEVLDGERAAVTGARGQLVGTHLSNTTAPLVRYATGDEGRFVRGGSCACGSEWPGIEAGSIRRLDAMLKVRGVNLWPASVEVILAEQAGIDDFWVVVGLDESAREELNLYVRPAAGTHLDTDALGDRLKEQTGLRFTVRHWPHDTPPEACRTNASGKTPRWSDTR